MNTPRKWISSLAIAATALVSFSIDAAEITERDGYSRTVKMWDLDLASTADVQQLYRRVQDAASRVCRAEIRRQWQRSRTLVPFGWEETCVENAIDEAVREVGNRRLAALHRETTSG
jgi:UrcA family protein